MTPDPRGFVLDGEDALAGVLGALSQAYSVTEATEPGSSGAVRRAWLDTFDWRLHAAGLVLEHEQTRRGGRLILTSAAGNADAAGNAAGANADTAGAASAAGTPPAEQPAPGWQSQRPAFPRSLPDGHIRDTVEPLAAPRALLPVARATSTRAVFRLLNDDGKTVVRLLVDRTAVSPPRVSPPRPARPAQAGQAAIGLPPRLTIAEVRGYSGQARRAAALVAAVPGALPAAGGVFAAALAALGRRPGDYTGKIGAEITGGMPGPVAIAVLLLDLLGTLERNVDGVLRDIDTEFLHDLRVAVRRTRSALKLLGDTLPAGLAARYAPEFKWLGDMTTPVRDLDVHLLGFDDLAVGLLAAPPAALEPFREFLRRRRASEFRRLAAVLRSARFRTLTEQWRKDLLEVRAAPKRPRRAARTPTARTLAAGRTGKAFEKITKRGAAITGQSPPESLHDLRKRCKELRYLLEFFAPVYAPGAYRKVLADLKKLQDCLGQYQDSQVQRDEIATLAEAMLAAQAAPAATLLAMGEIAARIAAGQQDARDDFASRFARFAGPAGQLRVTRLLASEAP